MSQSKNDSTETVHGSIQTQEGSSPPKLPDDSSLAVSRLESYRNEVTRTSVPFLPTQKADEKEATLVAQDAMAAKIKPFGDTLDKTTKGASSQDKGITEHNPNSNKL